MKAKLENPTVITAYPGFFMLSYDNGSLFEAIERGDNPEQFISRKPVIGWLIEVQTEDREEAYPFDTPITPGGTTLQDGVTLLQPDGSIVIYGVGIWDNMAEFLKAIKSKDIT